jgi:hypothetical protein
VRPDGRCEAHNVEVAAGDIFATRNSSQLLEITKDKKGTFPIEQYSCRNVQVAHTLKADSR